MDLVVDLGGWYVAVPVTVTAAESGAAIGVRIIADAGVSIGYFSLVVYGGSHRSLVLWTAAGGVTTVMNVKVDTTWNVDAAGVEDGAVT